MTAVTSCMSAPGSKIINNSKMKILHTTLTVCLILHTKNYHVIVYFRKTLLGLFFLLKKKKKKKNMLGELKVTFVSFSHLIFKINGALS